MSLKCQKEATVFLVIVAAFPPTPSPTTLSLPLFVVIVVTAAGAAVVFTKC